MNIDTTTHAIDKYEFINIIIAGGREFTDYNRLTHTLNHLTQHYRQITVVCGLARGADKLGERWAKEFQHDIEYYPADWDKHGKSAGYKRNEQMALNADALVAFWDGTSKGTKHMIGLAKKHKLAVRIVKY